MSLPDFSSVYATLKDFQRATVEHAAQSLFGDAGTGRFLVADEVGLGKTLVARGLIARALEYHDRIGTGRIDVVYICSNGDIARQNIRRLNVIEGHDFAHATRLTLLPRLLRDIQGERINFVSFTPGTSFNLRSAEGIQPERALILNMLKAAWGSEVKWGYTASKVFSGYARWRTFDNNHVRNPANHDFDASLLDGFRREMQAADGGIAALQDEYRWLHGVYRRVKSPHSKNLTDEVRWRRGQFVGRLRELLARACVEALEPDLVILDEFQRFKQLFDPEDPAGSLARALFDYPDVAVLLLSATPYKMYTRGGEEGENHYDDFLHTIRFLLKDDESTLSALRSDIGGFRRALFSTDPDAEAQALAAKHQIEQVLRRVMSRTERLASTPDRSGMLAQRQPPRLHLDADDVRGYVAFQQLGDRIEAGGAGPYWEATPYPLTYMDNYAFTRDFDKLVARDGGRGLRDLPLERLWVDWDDVAQYQRVDPGNSRMRSLEADVVDRGLWRLLWLPPSLPYHTLGGAYAEQDLAAVTKRLIFSSWRVVPKAIASHLSYESERRMVTSQGPAENSPEARERAGMLLNFNRTGGRLNGMPVVGLLYPGAVLAEVGDPLQLAGELGGLNRPVPLPAMMDVVRDRVAELLARLPEGPDATEREDQRWYWAAPLLLDRQAGPDATEAWLADNRLEAVLRDGMEASASDEHTNLQAHLDEALEVVRGDVELGRKPADLDEVVAELALAGPGICALRALGRSRPELGRWHPNIRAAAASIAFGTRSLFNAPDVTTMLRAESRAHTREGVYWRLVLRYCLDGGLQSVLDEWVHVLIDARALADRGIDEYLADLTEVMREALMVQTVNYRVRRLERDNGQVQLSAERMRGHLALRFGDEAAGESESGMQRAATVRVAFNSPFRPFVLATTSVGQEGLDFHTYCHAVVHWNLPSNPVDLEQREGRVHRYKGHAVRRNVAAQHRVAAMQAAGEGDPWTAMFDAAAAHRDDEDDELVPYWVYAPSESSARIERYVPALPLSREAQRLEQLRRTTAAYRLVFGQPRQEDLVSFLQDRDIQIDTETFRIDLRPAANDGSGRSAVSPNVGEQS